MLTAALVCIPESLKTETTRSEAPLITLGCSIKLSVELTKPVNLTQVFILFKSPEHAFLACAIMLKAHLLAALYPSSVVNSLPSLPLISSPLSFIDI